MPHSIANLAAAYRADIPAGKQQEHLVRFLRGHLADGEYERLMRGMMTDELPEDTVALVVEAIATWGTARPTVPSSRCA